jgi:hypothetical protein
MSKVELQVIARIILISVGLYVLLQTFLSIFSTVAAMPIFVSTGVGKMPIIIIALGIYATITMAMVYFLFRCANRLSAKIVGAESADDTHVSWLAVAFHLMCVSAGVLFLYWSIPELIVSISMYLNFKSGQQVYVYSRPDIVRYIVMLVISIYFAFGASGFVRWQVKRTLRQCSKYEEQKPTWH